MEFRVRVDFEKDGVLTFNLGAMGSSGIWYLWHVESSVIVISTAYGRVSG